MKQVYSISLAILLCLVALVYSPLVSLFEMQLKKAAELKFLERFSNGFLESEKTYFYFALSDPAIPEKGSEFERNGLMYDVISRRTTERGIVIEAWQDEQDIPFFNLERFRQEDSERSRQEDSLNLIKVFAKATVQSWICTASFERLNDGYFLRNSPNQYLVDISMNNPPPEA